MKSGILLGNFDKLIALLEKHGQECPKFAKDLELLNQETDSQLLHVAHQSSHHSSNLSKISQA